MPRRSPTLTLFATLFCAGCAAHSLWLGPRRPLPSIGPPVALITEGTAFTRPGLREEVARIVAEVSWRRVILLDSPPGVTDPRVEALALRVVAADRSLESYDWRKARCSVDAPVLAALAHDVDAVYRVTLDYRERRRPATATEAIGSPGARLLGALRLAAPGVVREESVEGNVAVWGFGKTGPVQRNPVTRTESRLEPSVFTPRLDVSAVAAEALRALPPPEFPAWDPLARRLLAANCPFHALAVHETRLAPAEPRMRNTALAALRAPARRHPSRAATPPVAPAPEPQDATPRAEDRYSCTDLCGMHMVEMCNRDQSLWGTHRKKWEATACGTMRSDPFLKECYRQQWLSGAFHASCVRPCESTSEGRERLLGILQSAGCLRRRSS